MATGDDHGGAAQPLDLAADLGDMTVAGRVAAGCRFMDELRPGWWRDGTFRLEIFDLASRSRCVLGQIFGDFNTGLDRLDLDTAHAQRLGMFVSNDYVDDIEAEYDAIEEEWRRVIAARRAMQGGEG